MNQQEIEEGNKLIAEFMGWVKSKQGEWTRPEDSSIVEGEKLSANWERHLKFNTSWDWLMPAYKKVRDEIIRSEWYEDNYTEYSLKQNDLMQFSLETANRPGLFRHLCRFIQWYNQQQK